MRELRKETEIEYNLYDYPPDIFIRNERTPKGDGNLTESHTMWTCGCAYKKWENSERRRKSKMKADNEEYKKIRNERTPKGDGNQFM